MQPAPASFALTQIYAHRLGFKNGRTNPCDRKPCLGESCFLGRMVDAFVCFFVHEEHFRRPQAPAGPWNTQVWGPLAPTTNPLTSLLWMSPDSAPLHFRLPGTIARNRSRERKNGMQFANPDQKVNRTPNCLAKGNRKRCAESDECTGSRYLLQSQLIAI